MSDSATSVGDMFGYTAGRFIGRLLAAGSELGRQLEQWRVRPLREYLESLVPARETTANEHLVRLSRALERYLTDRDGGQVDDVCNSLLEVPIIQQADHSNLLLDPETFLNNFLFHIACREAGVSVAITSQCSTVSCLWKRDPVAGPVFLRSRGAVFKVFPLSKRKFKQTTFCCLPPLAMTFDLLEGSSPPPRSDPVLRHLLGREVSDAPRGYRACNEAIWSLLDVDHSIRRVAVDESLASECVAIHLGDPTSPVYQLLFEPNVRDCFLEAKRELVRAPDNLAVNHATPDFLWLKDGSRLRKVVVAGRWDNARFVTASDMASLPVAYTPSALAEALRTGILYCDRVLAYTVRSLLPGAVAIGGTSQQDYVKLYRRALLETHREVPFLSDTDVRRIRSPHLSRLGGMPLIELDENAAALLAYLGPNTRLDEFEQAYLDRPVAKTIGELRCADYLKSSLVRFEAAA